MCYRIDLPSGGTAHVNVADDIGHESMQAVMAVVEAAEAHIKHWNECMAASPARCSECPGNDEGGPRCQCV